MLESDHLGQTRILDEFRNQIAFSRLAFWKSCEYQKCLQWPTLGFSFWDDFQIPFGIDFTQKSSLY